MTKSRQTPTNQPTPEKAQPRETLGERNKICVLTTNPLPLGLPGVLHDAGGPVLFGPDGGVVVTVSVIGRWSGFPGLVAIPNRVMQFGRDAACGEAPHVASPQKKIEMGVEGWGLEGVPVW